MTDRHHGHRFGVAILLLLTMGCGTLQNHWEETRAADTIAAYAAFVEAYPEAAEAALAREILARRHAQKDWEEAEKLDSPAAYRDFLARHPAGREAEKAQARLQALPPPPGEDLPETDRYSGTFLKRHAQGLLRTDHPPGEEELAFAETQRQGTLPAYETFLRRYPGGDRAAEARDQLEALFFREVQTEGTIAACERYLQRYPQGRFADEVRSQREKLARQVIMTPRRFANIRAARTANAPLKGRLRAGDLVRTDFLRNGWYAVFAMTETEQREERALGYVQASLLVPAAAGRGESRPPAGENPPPPPSGEAAQASPVTVKEIVFQTSEEGRELLRIEFSRHYLPVLSSIEGRTPRIVIELRNAHPLSPQWASMETGGRLIRWIYGRTDKVGKSAQIILEMAPRKDYTVHPVYYERDHAYVLEVSEVSTGVSP